jgi:hypothetical protein
MRNAYRLLVRRPAGKKPFKRPRRTEKIISEWILGK